MKYSVIAAAVLSLAATSWAASGAVAAINAVAATIEETLPAYEATISMFLHPTLSLGAKPDLFRRKWIEKEKKKGGGSQGSNSRYVPPGQASAQIQSDASASVVVQAEAAISANLVAIVAVLAAAEASILAATAGAAGGVQAQAAGLAQSDLDTLAADVELVAGAVAGLGVALSVVVALGGSARAAVGAELEAAGAAVAPFAGPVEAYVAAVLTSTAAATLTVTGVRSAQADLLAAVASVGTL